MQNQHHPISDLAVMICILLYNFMLRHLEKLRNWYDKLNAEKKWKLWEERVARILQENVKGKTSPAGQKWKWLKISPYIVFQFKVKTNLEGCLRSSQDFTLRETWIFRVNSHFTRSNDGLRLWSEIDAIQSTSSKNLPLQKKDVCTLILK